MQTNMRRGDLKYYHQIHCNKQKALGNHPVSYSNFVNRLRDGMNLHDAIYTPRAEGKVRHANKTPIQDAIRRRVINQQENIQILDLDYLMELEMKNQIKMPKPKKSLRVRFLELFKKN